MSVLDVPGARLYHEIHGSGPLLVMIAGANGVADGFRMVVGHLGEHMDDQPATVFGTSSGGLVALEALTRHPSVVRALIPYEPPAMRLLCDGQRWVDFFHEAYDVYRRSGIEPALKPFRERAFVQSDRQVMAALRGTIPTPPTGSSTSYASTRLPTSTLPLSPPTPIGSCRPSGGNDAATLPTKPPAELGRVIHRDVVALPGGHVGFVSRPAGFARELVLALQVSSQSG